MSADRILQRYVTGQTTGSGSDLAVTEGEDAETFDGCFGLLRGTRDRAVSLELRQKSGRILAINYAYVAKFEFTPDVGIVIHYADERITIKGRNLNAEARPNVRLFQCISRFRVTFVQEVDRAAALRAGDNTVLVESIEW